MLLRAVCCVDVNRYTELFVFEGLEWIPVIKDWRLNERNYGALVGRHKKQCVEEYGKDQVKKWRRSWDVPPPPMSTSSVYWPGRDARYKHLGTRILACNILVCFTSLLDFSLE